MPGLEGPIPFWLEKVHAKRQIQINYDLLDYDPITNFDIVLKKFIEHAMQQTKVHEPTRL